MNSVLEMHDSSFTIHDNEMLLKGKTAIITGGGTGIGRAAAILFTKEGANVTIFGRREDKLKEVKKTIKDDCRKDILAISGNVADVNDIKRLVNETIKKYGKVNVLVNNAGIFSGLPMHETDASGWDEVMDINLKGAFLVTREVVPYMLKNKGGSIINIASILGLVAIPCAAAYNTSKGGLAMFTKSIAIEYAKENIRANCICPGLVETPMTEDYMSNKELMKEVIKDYPMERFGKPEDITYPCLFFASDWSSWITGAILPVDGGYTAR